MSTNSFAHEVLCEGLKNPIYEAGALIVLQAVEKVEKFQKCHSERSEESRIFIRLRDPFHGGGFRVTLKRFYNNLLRGR